jgi:hypothetical protein
MKKLSALVFSLFIALLSAHAQILTIAINPNSLPSNGFAFCGGVLTIDSNSVASLKSLIGVAGLQISSQGASVLVAPQSLEATPVVIAGPATIQIVSGSSNAFATFSVEPAPFPPGRTVTVGAYSGNVQVTMQMSTDLVNWTTATNAQVYTNSPDARFFRIQLNNNPSP